jgi:hypothetical protein
MGATGGRGECLYGIHWSHVVEGQAMGMGSHVEEFQCCVTEYRRSLEELRQIEDRMALAVDRMALERAPRERLLAAQDILSTVRHTLHAAQMRSA